MSEDRRVFLGRLAAGAMLGALPLSAEALHAFGDGAVAPTEWDLSWTQRIRGKYRAVFDVPEIDSGYGVWRATLWTRQYHDVLGAAARDLSPVLVLRHVAVVLAMQQAFWDTYGVAKKYDVKHPITQDKTDRNPVLLSSTRNEVPAMFDDAALDKFLARGGIVLACNVALDDMVDLVATQDNLSPTEARAKAVAGLVPGVILQPSGVFAAIRAQDVGCRYLRAS